MMAQRLKNYLRDEGGREKQHHSGGVSSFLSRPAQLGKTCLPLCHDQRTCTYVCGESDGWSKKTHAQFNPLRMGVAGWVASDRELCKASGRQHEKWGGSAPPPQKVGVPKHPLPPHPCQVYVTL